MRTVFFVGSFKLGGTERVSILIGRELLRRGHDIRFILLNSTDDFHNPDVAPYTISLRGESVHSPIKPLVMLHRLRNTLRELKPDRVISFSKGLNLLLLLAHPRHMVFTIESNMFIYTRKLHRRYLQKYAAIFSRVRKVIVPSHGLYKACKAYFGKAAGRKLVMLPNPVAVPEHIEPVKEQGKFIVSAGRLVSSKGFDELIYTFGESSLKGRYRLLILGDGPERPNLEKLIKDQQLDEDVSLKGFTTNPYAYFSQASFFVLNTRHESFGNVLVEAMSTGVPVICRDCDYGPREIIDHGRSGFLFTDRTALKEYMELLADDESLAEQMGERAREAADPYRVERVTDQWEKEILA